MRALYELGSGIVVIRGKDNHCEMIVDGVKFQLHWFMVKKVLSHYIDEVRNETVKEVTIALHKRFGLNKEAAHEFTKRVELQILELE